MFTRWVSSGVWLRAVFFSPATFPLGGHPFKHKVIFYREKYNNKYFYRLLIRGYFSINSWGSVKLFNKILKKLYSTIFLSLNNGTFKVACAVKLLERNCCHLRSWFGMPKVFSIIERYVSKTVYFPMWRKFSRGNLADQIKVICFCKIHHS